MSDTQKTNKTDTSLRTDVSALMEEFEPRGRVLAAKKKSSEEAKDTISAKEFADLDISPDFKPIREETQVGDAVAAFVGTNEVAGDNTNKKSQNAGVPNAAAPVANDPAPANDDKPRRSKLPVTLVAVASVALVAVVGAQSWKFASAVETTDFETAAPLVPVVSSQPQNTTPAVNDVPQPVTTKLALAAPSGSSSIAVPAQPSNVSAISNAVPAPTSASKTVVETPIVEKPVVEKPVVKKPVVKTTTKFTLLPSDGKPGSSRTPSLSRGDCEARYRTVSRSGSINFESGSATIIESSQPVLRFLANVYQHCKDFDIVVAGHTDAIGGAESNKKLSVRRAASVAEYLSGMGVPSGSIRVVGYGESKPIATNDTALRRSRNRRIEFLIEDG